MATYVHNYAETLAQLLDRPVDTADDFASLAVAGEQLRRAVEATPDADTTVTDMLERYNAWLRSYEGDVPDELESDVLGVLADVASYAATATHERQLEDGERLLQELDEVLSIGAAATRAGRLDNDTLQRFGTLVTPRLGELMPKLHDLLQFAEEQELIFGADPEYPALYSFWEQLAQFAPSRVALEVSVVSAGRKAELMAIAERVYDEHLAAMAQTVSVTPSFADLVRGAFDRLAAALPSLPRPAAQAGYSDAAIKLRRHHKSLLATEELEIIVADNKMVSVVAEGHKLSLRALVASTEVATSQVDARTVELTIPSQAAAIQLIFTIDGEEMPVLELPIDYE